MPKTKELVLEEEEKVLDPELVVGDVVDDEESEETTEGMDDEEVDPFKDKWEE